MTAPSAFADDNGNSGSNPGGNIASAGVNQSATYLCWLNGSTGTNNGTQFFTCSNGNTGIHP
ncbi:hypothetical protein D5S17_27575 [Pseudonocardiaceae bacterium YIM PH 21723]|nr:hypothetical protein D5S17_27575 [Pseudonocardiaceae bacterium YIM PH 21723]